MNQSLFANGLQGDASWIINDQHTLRGGVLLNLQSTTAHQDDSVFPVDALGNPTSDVPLNIQDGGNRLGAEYGVYLQDEWKIVPALTVNFGGRFDVVDAYDHENQLSPRGERGLGSNARHDAACRLCPLLHPAAATGGRAGRHQQIHRHDQ